MRDLNPSLHTTDGFYRALLFLYPPGFRRQFGSEMIQIFRDCCRAERRSAGVVRLWVHILTDLAFSVPREWQLVMIRADRDLDYTGLADAFMIATVVGTNLIGWGWMAAAVVLNGTLPGVMHYWNTAALILDTATTIAMAALIGVLSAVAVARAGRIRPTRVKV